MFPLILPSLISGAAGLLGGMFSSDTSAKNTQANIQNQQMMQTQSMEFNAAEAQKTRDFQMEMSNTAFQRSRQDAMSAGLNPMVLAGMGGASTPSGATASTTAPNVSNISQNRHPLQDIGRTVESMVSSAVASKTFEKMTEEIANLKTTNEKIVAETATERARPANIQAQTATETKRPALVSAQTTTEGKRPALVESETAINTMREELLRISKDESLTAAEKARLMRDVYENPITRKIIQAGMVGSSARDALSPVKDIIDTVIGTAFKKKGLDIMREKLSPKSGSSVERSYKTDDGYHVKERDWYGSQFQ